MSAVTDTFWQLCSEIDEALQGVDDVRPALYRLLELVRSAPAERDELVKCFIEVLKGRGPWEVPYFCMRHLRWPEVFEAATALLSGTDDFRTKHIMYHVRNAYDPKNDDDEYLY
jgi:3-methyladenine DNA glycosylase/8-oxoguanine DNA glycosylase